MAYLSFAPAVLGRAQLQLIATAAAKSCVTLHPFPSLDLLFICLSFDQPFIYQTISRGVKSLANAGMGFDSRGFGFMSKRL
jgi:hypothetical protein